MHTRSRASTPVFIFSYLLSGDSSCVALSHCCIALSVSASSNFSSSLDHANRVIAMSHSQEVCHFDGSHSFVTIHGLPALDCTCLYSFVLTYTCLCTPYEFVLAHTCRLSLLVRFCSCLYTLVLLIHIYFQSYTLCASIFTGTCLFSLVHVPSYFHRLNLNCTRPFSPVHVLRLPAPTCTCLHPPALIFAHLCPFMPACTHYTSLRSFMPPYTYLRPPAFVCVCLHSFVPTWTHLCLCFQWYALVFQWHIHF